MTNILSNYHIEQRENGVLGRPEYHFHGAKGAHYRTMRRVNQPHILFVIDTATGKEPRPFRNVFLSDATDSLKIVREDR